MTVFFTPHSKVVILDGKITAMSLPAGDLWKWAFQRRRRVQRQAKDFCPKGKTHNLVDSIQGDYDPTVPRDTIIMRVSADTPYAKFVHQGAPPHPIYPRDRINGELRFWWEREGKFFHGRPGQHVNHPGIEFPRPFLTEALEVVMADIIRRGR